MPTMPTTPTLWVVYFFATFAIAGVFVAVWVGRRRKEKLRGFPIEPKARDE